MHRFSGGAAEAYDRGRAPYDPRVVAAFRLPGPPSRVADLGAGTGLLTRALRHAGHEVVPVEPAPDMRARLGGDALAAPAEDTGLPDGAFDGVVAGDAWHWFDAPAAAAEAHRLLRPRGRLAVAWRFPAPTDVPELLALRELLGEVRGDHPAYAGEAGREAIAAHPGFAPLEHEEVRVARRVDGDVLLAEVASISFVNVHPDREGVLAEAAARLRTLGPVDVAVACSVWRTRRR